MQCFIHVKSISRKKFGSSNSEISAFCTSKEYDNVTTPYHPFSLYSLIWQVVTYGRLKTKENFKLLALKSGRGRLRYLHILQKYQDIFAMTYKVLCLTASSSITKHKIFQYSGANWIYVGHDFAHVFVSIDVFPGNRIHLKNTM